MEKKFLKLIAIFILVSLTIIAEEEIKGTHGVEVPKGKKFETPNEKSEYEISEENRRLFPLFRKGIEAQNIQLPMPFGVSVFGNVTNVKTGGEGLDVDFGKGNAKEDIGLKIEGDITAQITGVMLDFYPFPFLNVFGYGGYIRTSGDLKIGGADGKIPMTAVNFGDSGQAYGLGVNLAGGYKKMFAGLNSTYSLSKMSKTGAIKPTFIITPRIGVKNEKNTFQLWTGLMYMQKNSQLTGDMKDGTIGQLPAFSYALNLEGPEFSPTIGFRYEPVRHFEVVTEAFLANDFNGINMRLSYRF